MKYRLATVLLVALAMLGATRSMALAANIITDNPITQAAKNPISFTPEVPIPGLFDKTQDITNSSIGVYIKAIYVYFIWVVGVLSVVMVTYGGVRWVAAAGNASRINEARETINNAIIGLIIALTSYTLLNIINPNFLKLQPIAVQQVVGNYYQGAATTTICPTSQNVPCGEVRKTGAQVTGANGDQVDAYCLGTICSGGQTGVCQVSKVRQGSLEYYTPIQTCTDTIPIQPTGTGQYASMTSMHYTDASNQHEGIVPDCGLILESIAQGFGTRCSNSAGHGCYLLGDKGIILDSPSPDSDQITNMRCPAP